MILIFTRVTRWAKNACFAASSTAGRAAAISAFLERPSVVSKEQYESSPHVVAFRNEHTMAGSGQEAYVTGLESAAVNNRPARSGMPVARW